MTPLKIAAGGVAMFTLLTVFAIQRIPVPEPAAAAERRFDAAWQDTAAVIPPLKKADRLQIVSAEPKSAVDAARIVPAPDNAPASMPPVVLVQSDDKPPVSQHRRHHKSEPGRVETNVCTRHKMKKVTIRGGKSWRCRK
jgi:hypothetical protein